MSFEVWPEDRRMSSPLPTRYGPRNPATPGLPRPHDLLRNVFHCKHLETCWHRSGDFLCYRATRYRSMGADAGTASKQQILRAVVAARSGGTTIVRFESNRAASQESSSHRHADERVDRCRSAGGGHGHAGADGVGVGSRRTAARQDRPGPGRDHRPDARQLLHRRRQEPLHRADSSGRDHRVHRGDRAHGVLAHHGGRSPRLARDRAAEHLGSWWPGVAG